jgi:hypothetical protein
VLLRLLQALFTPDPFDPLVVSSLALCAQEFADLVITILTILLVGAVVFATAAFDNEDSVGSRLLASAGFDCSIEGKTSRYTGERIYNVRGQEYYDETIISQRHGERWFCNEEDAREAGWRQPT